MKVGGYQIIDLKGLDLANSPDIEGLYDLIEGTRKPILVSGIVNNGTEYQDSFVAVENAGDHYNLSLIGGNLIIGVYDNGTVMEEV